MSQFQCEICGEGFEQRSRYERHLLTSHPARAVDAATLEKAIAGVDFPAGTATLAARARQRDADEVARLLEELPDRSYRDAAEVARAFGELRSHEPAASHQPGKLGGRRALESPSAARISQAFAGMRFPASGDDLKRHAHHHEEDEAVLAVIDRFGEGPYHDASDVAREVGRVT